MAWQGEYTTTTNIAADKLFNAITDINSWPQWDHGLEHTQLAGPAVPGASFTLKPRGGPLVKLTIDECAPWREVHTAHLFLGKMRSSHTYTQQGKTTQIVFTIEVWGILGFFWRTVLGKKLLAEAPAHTADFIAYVRTL